jgi:hypothetical protein
MPNPDKPEKCLKCLKLRISIIPNMLESWDAWGLEG